MQAEEILDLGAGNQHRDAVGKSNNHRPRNKFHRRAHAGGAQHDQDGARHDGAHVQPVDAVHRDDPGHDHDECARGSADLSFRSAQGGDQEAGHDCAVNARLRRQPGGDGKRHSERQCHQANGDAGDDVLQKLVQSVFAKADDGLGQPPVVQL